jgi:hypothetical protein
MGRWPEQGRALTLANHSHGRRSIGWFAIVLPSGFLPIATKVMQPRSAGTAARSGAMRGASRGRKAASCLRENFAGLPVGGKRLFTELTICEESRTGCDGIHSESVKHLTPARQVLRSKHR